MKHDSIQQKHVFILSFLFLCANCYSLLYASNTGRSVWLCYLFAGVLASLVAWLLAHALQKSKLDFFQLLDRSFTPVIGKLLALFLAIYAFLSAGTSLSIFGRFNQLTALSETPTLILPLAVILLSIRASRSGISTIARMGNFVFYFILAVFFTFALLGINFLSPQALTPLRPNQFSDVVFGALTVFVNQFGDLLFLSVLSCAQKKSRAFVGGTVAAGIVLSVIALMTVMTLGEAEILTDSYPVFTVLSIRSIGQFIQHLEILSSIAMTLIIFFRVSIALTFVGLALKHLFSLEECRAALFPLGLLLTTITQVMYRNMLVLRERLESPLTLMIALPLQVLLPLVLFLLVMIKSRNKHTLGSK